MKTARDRILAKLRAAPVQPPVEPDVAGYYAQHTPPTTLPDRLRQFSRMMRAVHTELHYTHAHGWPTLLARIVRDKNIGSVLLAPRTPHGERAVVALSQLDTAPQLLTFDQPIEAWKDQLFNGVAAAFTGSRAGIADTGVIDADMDRAETGDGLLDGVLHRFFIDDIDLDEHYLCAKALNDRLTGGFVKIKNGDLGAHSDKLFDCRQSQARCTTGNDGDTVFNFHLLLHKESEFRKAIACLVKP